MKNGVKGGNIVKGNLKKFTPSSVVLSFSLSSHNYSSISSFSTSRRSNVNLIPQYTSFFLTKKFFTQNTQFINVNRDNFTFSSPQQRYYSRDIEKDDLYSDYANLSLNSPQYYEYKDIESNYIENKPKNDSLLYKKKTTEERKKEVGEHYVDFVTITQNLKSLRDYIINGRFQQIHNFFERHGYPPRAFNFLIVKLLQTEREYEAFKLLEYVIKYYGNISKVDLNVIIMTFHRLLLIQKYDFALSLFHQVKSHINPLTAYAFIIKLYSKLDDHSTCEKYFEETKYYVNHKHISPKSSLFNTNFSLDSSFPTKSPYSFIKTEKFEAPKKLPEQPIMKTNLSPFEAFLKATDIEKKMDEETKKELVIIYTSMIEVHCNSGNLLRSIELLNEMEKSDIPRSIIIYNQLLMVYLKFSNIGPLLNLFESIKNREFGEDVKEDIATLNIILLAYFKTEELSLAITHFENTLKDYPDIVNTAFYNSMIGEFFKRDKKEEALNYYQRLKESNLGIDRGTFVPMINFAIRNDDINGAEEIFGKLQQLNLKPTVSMLNSLISALFKAEKVHRAFDYHLMFYDEGLKQEKSSFISHLSSDVINRDLFHLYSPYFLNAIKDERLTKKIGYSLFNLFISAFYLRLKDNQLALLCYTMMMKGNLLKNKMTYSLMISVFAQSSQCQKSIDLYIEFLQKFNKKLMTATMYEEVLLSYAVIGDLDEFQNVYKEFIQSYKKRLVTRITLEKMINAFKERNQLEYAEKLPKFFNIYNVPNSRPPLVE